MLLVVRQLLGRWAPAGAQRAIRFEISRGRFLVIEPWRALAMKEGCSAFAIDCPRLDDQRCNHRDDETANRAQS